MEPSQQPRSARILLAGDYSAVRQDLRQLIELAESGCEVSEAPFSEEAVNLTRQVHPHLVILDLEAGRRDLAAGILRQMKSLSPTPRLFVLTVRDASTWINEADSLFIKGRETQKLLDAVHHFLTQPHFSR